MMEPAGLNDDVDVMAFYDLLWPAEPCWGLLWPPEACWGLQWLAGTCCARWSGGVLGAGALDAGGWGEVYWGLLS